MKELSLIIFVIFNLSFFFIQNKKEKNSINTELSQETVFQDLDGKSDKINQNNIFDKSISITYLY